MEGYGWLRDVTKRPATLFTACTIVQIQIIRNIDPALLTFGQYSAPGA
jgi:hypothetical protein